MCVVNNRTYFHSFIGKKRIVTLGLTNHDQFKEVGTALAAVPEKLGFVFAFFSGMLGTRDHCCTMATGCLMAYSGFKTVTFNAGKFVHFEHHTGKEFIFPYKTETVMGYADLNLRPASSVLKSNEKISNPSRKDREKN